MIRDCPRSIIGTAKSQGRATILAITPEGQAVPLFELGSSARPTILIVSSPERLLHLFRSPFCLRPTRLHIRTQKGEEPRVSFTQCLFSAMAHSDTPVNGDKSLRDSRYLCECPRINTAVAVERTTLVRVCDFNTDCYIICCKKLLIISELCQINLTKLNIQRKISLI